MNPPLGDAGEMCQDDLGPTDLYTTQVKQIHCTIYIFDLELCWPRQGFNPQHVMPSVIENDVEQVNITLYFHVLRLYHQSWFTARTSRSRQRRALRLPPPYLSWPTLLVTLAPPCTFCWQPWPSGQNDQTIQHWPQGGQACFPPTTRSFLLRMPMYAYCQVGYRGGSRDSS